MIDALPSKHRRLDRRFDRRPPAPGVYQKIGIRHEGDDAVVVSGRTRVAPAVRDGFNQEALGRLAQGSFRYDCAEPILPIPLGTRPVAPADRPSGRINNYAGEHMSLTRM